LTKPDFHFPFQQDVHDVTFIAFPKKDITGRELHRITILTKKVCWIHEGQSLQKRAQICQVTIV
jgi:hypothetical protein